jgi:glycosyltransferase involved in cell wall biosynthesis
MVAAIDELNQTPLPAVGIVVIGRNEGPRLTACFDTLPPNAQVVYVDSNSTDNSVQIAESFGFDVVILDLSIPFTAARGRNTGWRFLVEKYPEINYIQFIDGDCQVNSTWWINAINTLNQSPSVGVVCGRRREIFPEKSIYNALCDWEWDTPVGEVKSCGGDAMMRLSVLQQVGGFSDHVIAGEEPELCIRIRSIGFRVMRIDAEMTLHDANILHFRQWWRRSVRAGFAFALGSAMHGGSPSRHWMVETRRAIIWGLILPLLICVSLVFSLWPATCGIFVYFLQYFRLYRRAPRLQYLGPACWAWLLSVSKFAEAQGVVKYWLSRQLHQNQKIIEYK